MAAKRLRAAANVADQWLHPRDLARRRRNARAGSPSKLSQFSGDVPLPGRTSPAIGGSRRACQAGSHSLRLCWQPPLPPLRRRLLG